MVMCLKACTGNQLNHIEGKILLPCYFCKLCVLSPNINDSDSQAIPGRSGTGCSSITVIYLSNADHR